MLESCQGDVLTFGDRTTSDDDDRGNVVRVELRHVDTVLSDYKSNALEVRRDRR